MRNVILRCDNHKVDGEVHRINLSVWAYIPTKSKQHLNVICNGQYASFLDTEFGLDIHIPNEDWIALSTFRDEVNRFRKTLKTHCGDLSVEFATFDSKIAKVANVFRSLRREDPEMILCGLRGSNFIGLAHLQNFDVICEVLKGHSTQYLLEGHGNPWLNVCLRYISELFDNESHKTELLFEAAGYSKDGRMDFFEKLRLSIAKPKDFHTHFPAGISSMIGQVMLIEKITAVLILADMISLLEDMGSLSMSFRDVYHTRPGSIINYESSRPMAQIVIPIGPSQNVMNYRGDAKFYEIRGNPALTFKYAVPPPMLVEGGCEDVSFAADVIASI